MAVVGATGSLGGFTGGNALARLLVVFSGDTSSLDAAIARTQGTMAGFASNAASIGKSLTRAVTLPVLAVGGAALFMASQFESAIGRIAGLTPIVDQVQGGIGTIRTRLLELAQVVPTAPNDLAESLYYAGSAGLDAESAFQVVQASAEGAAIGMGEAADISKVLIAALNNFGSPAGGPLTAADAMDALTAAIREGTAAPDELAVSLGRVLPVAKEAGVTFQETVASIASLTNIGVPTRVATTSLRALFAELLAPTQQASARLDTLGISADKVRNVLAQFGPIAAFQLIEDAVHGDEDALRDILPQIRGFTAYLGIADDRLNESRRIFDEVTNSSGDFQKALAIIAQTPQFKFGIALNKMRVAAIDLGTVLFPVFSRIIDIIGSVGDALANLPDPVQKMAVAFALLAAAVGPVLQLLGNMGALLSGPIAGVKAFTTNTLVAGLAVVTLVASFQSLASGSRSLSSVLITVAAGATAVFTALRLIQGAAQAGALGVNALSLGLVSMSTGGLALAAIGVGVLVAAIALLIGSSNRAAKAAEQMGESLKTAAQGGQLFSQAIKGIEDEGLANRIRSIANALGLLNKAVTSGTLDQLQAGIGGRLTTQLDALSTSLHTAGEDISAAITPEEIQRFEKFRAVIEQAAASGQDLGPALKAAGLDGAEFFGLLSDLNIAPISNIRDQANNVDQLARSYATNLQVLKDFQAETAATIALRGADAAATARYASEIGVSTEYLQARLDEVGVSAVGMDENSKAAFEDLVFVSDDTGRRVAANVAEMQAQIDEATTAISESVASAFGGFEKAENDLKGTTASLLTNFEANSRAIVDMVGGLNQLASQGLPVGLLNQLAEGGPEMVKKFVDATPAELKRLTAAYEAELAATDAAILDESNLQGEKGKGMVQQFVSGILSNAQLPPQVASRIVNDMIQKFASGNVNAAGLQQALQFAKGLNTVKNLTGQEATQAMDAFIAGIGKRNLLSLGARQVREFANGISQASGISKTAAQTLVQNTINALRGKEQPAHDSGDTLATKFREGVSTGVGPAQTAGQQVGASAVTGLSGSKGGAASTGSAVGNAYVSSLAARKDAAYNAGFAVGKAGVDGMKAGAKNSPKYGSYYLGIDLIDQLAEGMEKGKAKHGFSQGIGFRFPVTLNQGRVADEGGRRRPGKRDLDLDVTIDRTRTAKALDWEYSVRGR
jgi:TP901 family phage tail tape measure protein